MPDCFSVGLLFFMENVSLRTVPVFQVGFRTSLIKGVDWRIFVFLGFYAASLVWTWGLMNVFIDILIAVGSFGIYKGGQAMGKADPRMFDVWQRNISYKAFYSAHAYGGSPCMRNYQMRSKWY